MKQFSLTAPFVAVGLAAALVLVGCTTTPERVAELEQARSSVQRLESEPKAERAASEKLTRAREALNRADIVLEKGGSIDEVRHEAYLARRHAEIGLQLTAEAEAREELGKAESRRNELRLQARTREAERATTLAERRAQQAEANAREAQLSRSVADAAVEEANRLANELKEMKAEQTERGMVLTLGDVLFETNKAQLSEGAMLTMDRLAEYLGNYPERRLLIEGHTDARGSEEYNRELARERAGAVALELTQRGIASDRLRTAGLGESFPVASNETATGMQQNRRVEIVISNPDGTFPRAAEQRLRQG